MCCARNIGHEFMSMCTVAPIFQLHPDTWCAWTHADNASMINLCHPVCETNAHIYSLGYNQIDINFILIFVSRLSPPMAQKERERKIKCNACDMLCNWPENIPCWLDAVSRRRRAEILRTQFMVRISYLQQYFQLKTSRIHSEHFRRIKNARTQKRLTAECRKNVNFSAMATAKCGGANSNGHLSIWLMWK